MFSSDTNTPSLRTDFKRVASGIKLAVIASLMGGLAAATGNMSYLGLGALICGTGILIRNNPTLSHSSQRQPG